MRIFLVTLGSLLIFFISFLIVKMWGQSQIYPIYQHPMLALGSETVEFRKPTYSHLLETIKSKEFLYLDVAITVDQKLVVPQKLWGHSEKGIRYSTYNEIKNDVLLLQDLKDILKKKKIIFNIIENSQAVHENFIYNMQQLGLEKGENFIVTSPYEAPIKSLKELAPSFIYGTTQPEILKILAMGSMYLYEAVNIRADIIIHPLKIRNRTFYTDDLLKEISRRHKKIIVGPIHESEKEEALKLKPYGLIIED